VVEDLSGGHRPSKPLISPADAKGSQNGPKTDKSSRTLRQVSPQACSAIRSSNIPRKVPFQKGVAAHVGLTPLCESQVSRSETKNDDG